ncbi:MAG TPA: peptidase M3 [Myxococcaceae bacterium]|nr:peptidase M3 [Myxococcaceae bacterium]
MDPSLKALRAQVDPYLRELGTLQYRHGAGLPTDTSVHAIRAETPELHRPDAFEALRDAIGGKMSDDDTPRRMRRLLELVAGEREDVLAASASQAVSELEARGSVTLGAYGEDALPFHEAIARLPREGSREKRAALESGLGRFLWEHSGPYARRLEATVRLAEELGAPSYVKLREEVSGFTFAPLVEEGEKALARTEDAYRDVLGYVLKKLDATVRPLPSGTGRRHDVQYVSGAPQLARDLRWEDLMPALSHWLTDFGLTPDAERRIRLDTDRRPGKSPRPFVAAIQVPDEIRLVISPDSGLAGASAILHEYGHAQHLAHVERKAPVEDRRLLDASVSEAYASLFDHLLLDEAWLRRYLRMPSSLSRETARLAAFRETMLLRRHAAKLGYELSLYERGPGEELAEEYEERQRKALGVGVHRGFYLYDVDPKLYAARYLRGWALEARLHRVLQERFNEDWWRNPAAGSFLVGLFKRGGRDDAAELANELTGEPPSFEEVCARLIRVLGA